MSSMGEKSQLLASTQAKLRVNKAGLWLQFLVVISSVTTFLLFTNFYSVDITISKRIDSESKGSARDTRCKPHLPSTLVRVAPLVPSSHDFGRAIRKLDLVLQERAKRDDMDSLMVGIIGPNGLLWSKGYGVANANDTEAHEPPNEHSIYRLASISKMFTTLETFILRDRGVLNWDDPVTNFFPNLTYRPYGWREHLNHMIGAKELDPITLRQLATHMSGIGRDYPPANLDDWPHVPPPPFQSPHFSPEATYPNKEEILQAIADNPLVAPQYSYPIYSNTGYSLLGWCNTVAYRMVTGRNISHAELLKEDIFEPLGMNGSSFLLTSDNREQMVFPKDASEAEYDMTDAHNPAGGQMSSVSDLAKAVMALLNPKSKSPLLSPYSIREWLRPIHVFPDRFSQVGLAWEITQTPDRHGRLQHYYSKSGNLRTYHSQLTINQELGFGVVVLMTGSFPDSGWFTQKAIRFLQPVFESHLEEVTNQNYGGLWESEGSGGPNQMELKVKGGVLWVTKWIMNGDDYLKIYKHPKISLWSTGRLHEFRAGVGRDEDDAGCFLYWVTIDPFNSHNAPVDMGFFEGDGHDRVLRFPSANITLRRDQV
ncbi:beta-lactamase/transpeptidase-like protein [Serendipita vermifera]|nr:beta-lactamase/transpeptidase-like protein [Serendipita vermifera]